VELLSESAEGL
jgi:hypothetical protein